MDTPLTLLIHKLNNLLGVIYVQVDQARQTPGEEAKLRALALIEHAAQATEAEARRIRGMARGTE